MSKADYALGVEDGERKAAAEIADVLERQLPTLMYNIAVEMTSEVVEIIRLKGEPTNG